MIYTSDVNFLLHLIGLLKQVEIKSGNYFNFFSLIEGTQNTQAEI